MINQVAPACVVSQAAKQTKMNQSAKVSVPWARVFAPLVCAVIPDVLSSEEVQALKSWGMLLGSFCTSLSLETKMLAAF